MYRLQKYHGARTRHECPYCHRPRCFTLYVDENGQALSPLVGKCDHEIKCGAHYTPKDFFREHPSLTIPPAWLKPMEEEKRELQLIPFEQVQRFRTNDTSLVTWLSKNFDGWEKACDDYKIGGLKTGETIFWQIDKDGRCRSGKFIPYGADGHRIKTEGHEVGWMHTLLKKDGIIPKKWELTQCLFGEHLLDGRDVGLVESEKTAIICSMVYPNKVWLATGGKQNLNGERMQVLRGQRVLVYPDADAVQQWRERVTRMKSLGFDILCVDLHYTESQVENKFDIADLICTKMN